MDWFEFTSALIENFAWPILVGTLAFVFREPIAELIGRVRSYEGLGQKFTFGFRLAEAEDSVDEALKSIEPAKAMQAEAKLVDATPLAREAEANPSFVVLRSWEQLSGALADLVGSAMDPDEVGPKYAHSNPAAFLPKLVGRKIVDSGFVKAVSELRSLRNRVAHGHYNPTAGEAIAYLESANELAGAAIALANFHVESHQRSRGGR